MKMAGKMANMLGPAVENLQHRPSAHSPSLCLTGVRCLGKEQPGEDVRNVVSQLGELVDALTREGEEDERGRLASECAGCISRLHAETTPDRRSTQSTPRKRSPHPPIRN